MFLNWRNHMINPLERRKTTGKTTYPKFCTWPSHPTTGMIPMAPARCVIERFELTPYDCSSGTVPHCGAQP